MDVLLIGGSGFLSGTIARRALAAGHRVWALTRGRRSLPDGVESLVADRHDAAAFRQAIRAPGITFDAVIDCIGYAPEDAAQDVHELGKWARHLVFVSTDFVFDPSHRTFPQRDDNTAFLADDSYGAKKRRCEEILLNSGPRSIPWTILRPCHIYGPGSQLGCLPCHGRDPDLVPRLRRGETLRLVGGGHFLQQPILAADLADVALACPGNPRACGRILHTAGPDLVESRMVYHIIAAAIGCECRIEELSVQDYLADHPEHRSFMCHRIYSLQGLAEAGIPLPSTPLAVGLREQLRHMGFSCDGKTDSDPLDPVAST